MAISLGVYTIFRHTQIAAKLLGFVRKKSHVPSPNSVAQAATDLGFQKMQRHRSWQGVLLWKMANPGPAPQKKGKLGNTSNKTENITGVMGMLKRYDRDIMGL